MNYYVHFDDERTPRPGRLDSKEEARSWADSERPGVAFALLRTGDNQSGAAEITTYRPSDSA